MGHIFAENGKGLHFVGDFDALYREDADPWGQSGRNSAMASYYAESRSRLFAALACHGCCNHGLEIGCGHGHLLTRLKQMTHASWTGLDISAEAIRHARGLYPEFSFHVGDIAGAESPFPPNYIGKYDRVILSQILWYILERFDRAVSHALRLCAPGGLLVITQAFLKGEQRYGAEIANGFPGALSLFLERFPYLTLLEAQYDDSDRHAHHDGLLIFRKLR